MKKRKKMQKIVASTIIGLLVFSMLASLIIPFLG